MRKFLFLLLFVSLAAHAQSVDSKAVDRLVATTMAKWQIPGAAVAIVKDDKMVYAKGFGVRALGTNEKVTENTLFGIGSTSKAFTSAAMAILVDEKKLAWDDPVRKHLEYFHLSDPCADSLVTMRDIVSHRTGLSRHDELWDDSPWSREEIIRRIAQVKLSKPFRGAYQYQNIMFLTAGEAVAAAAKMPWNDFVKARIFQPLGMTRTVVSTADWNAASDRASGHRWDRARGAASIQTYVDDDNIAPAGAIKSSAKDMAQWVRFQLANGTVDGKRIVSAEALGETKMPQMVVRLEGDSKDNNPETNVQSYAMGWNVQDYAGDLLVAHGGALNGFRAQVDLLPKRNAGFVVLINEGRGLATVALRNAIADLLLGRPARDWDAYYLALDARSDEKAEQRKREREAKRQRDTHPSRELAAYAGTFENAGYGAATIAVENGQLMLRWNRLALPLTHYHYDMFNAVSEAADVDEQVVFRLGPDGEVATMTLFGEEFTRK
ncbi:MAG TPA: serine hydrolase [Thermoanaerobaculia bacterium]|jgi:CubicO group peptidase (beta-lactamase class C family)|nr:serine hydrolase [Thermoanaerobaculia bacterium]